MEDTFIYYFLDSNRLINFLWLRSFILFFVIRKSKIINVEFLIVHSSKNTVKKTCKDCRLVNLGVF